MNKTMTQEEYKEKLGNVCPQCQSHDIEGEGVDVDGNQAHQEVSCSNCFAVWVDTYTLSYFNLVDEGEQS